MKTSIKLFRSENGQTLIEGLILAPAIIGIISFVFLLIGVSLTYFLAHHKAFEYLICREIPEIRSSCYQKLINLNNYFLPDTKLTIQSEEKNFDRRKINMKMTVPLFGDLKFSEELLK